MHVCSQCEKVKSLSATRALFSIIARRKDNDEIAYVTCHNCKP